MKKISRETADVWASWFQALGDPSRVLMLHLLANEKRPMTIGEMVDALDIGQSTVSHHCRILEEAGFVLCERQGTSTKCRINTRCLAMFPTAADIIMGRAPRGDSATNGNAPWLESGKEGRQSRRTRTVAKQSLSREEQDDSLEPGHRTGRRPRRRLDDRRHKVRDPAGAPHGTGGTA